MEFDLQEATKSLIDTKKVMDAKLRSLGQSPLEGHDYEALALPGMTSAPADVV